MPRSQCPFQDFRLGNPPLQGGPDHLRLLMDLLEHEVAVLAFFGRVCTVLKAIDGTLNNLAIPVGDPQRTAANQGRIPSAR